MLVCARDALVSLAHSSDPAPRPLLARLLWLLCREHAAPPAQFHGVLRGYGTVGPRTPPAVELEPISVSQYCRAWWAGRVQAKSDVAEGILAREVYGFGGGGPAADILRKRYNIQTRALAGCIVDAKIVGHAAGYNAVSNAEIERRVGRARIKAAEAEGLAVALGTNERRKSYCEYLQNVSQSFQATRT